jgi:hypothetical protein
MAAHTTCRRILELTRKRFAAFEWTFNLRLFQPAKAAPQLGVGEQPVADSKTSETSRKLPGSKD